MMSPWSWNSGTMEEFIDGRFAKYISNDCKCKTLLLGDMKCVYQKAQSLVHYSYELSKRKFMLLDIQGSMYNSYDPGIATSELFDDEGEIYPSFQFRTLRKNTY